MRGRLALLRLVPLLVICIGIRAQETTWKIDPLHSAAHFSVRHMMISTVRGDFGGVNGIMHYDPKNIASSKVEATIDCSTVNTNVAARDAQMKTSDFFDVKKYPTMKFVSTKVEQAGPGKLKVSGDLTINAITKPVVLDVEGPSDSVKDARGRVKVGLTASTKINRKDWNIVWNEVLDSGGFAVADDVSITLDIEFIKQ